MVKRGGVVLLVVLSGWLLFYNFAEAQLALQWNYDISTLGWYAYIDNPVIVDDSGNAFVLSYAGEYLSGVRITKIKPDSTIAWQVSYPDIGPHIDYFDRSSSGDFYVGGHSELEGGWIESIVGKKFGSDGHVIWQQVIPSPAFHAFGLGDPCFDADVNGNLWVGITETTADSICPDSLPDGWGADLQAIIYRLEASSGTPIEVDRIEGGPLQRSVVVEIKASQDGNVNVNIALGEFCCNELCQGCLDSCYTDHIGLKSLFHDIHYLRRYTSGGLFLDSTWLATSDDDIFGVKIFSGRNGELLVYRVQYMSPPPYWSLISRFGHWSKSLSGETNLSHPYEPTTDYSGNVLMNHWLSSTKSTNDNPSEVVLLEAATGDILWSIPGLVGCLGADQDGNIYINDRTAIHKLDQWGAEQWVCTTSVDLGSILVVDTSGWFYFQNYTSLRRYAETKYVTIRDGRGDSIPNVQFDLLRVENNPPAFTEDTVGTFTTDSLGRLAMIPFARDTFQVVLDLNDDSMVVVGDSIRISKHVHSEPSIKHEGVLGTMYSVYLDNARFAEDGHMFFDSLTNRDQDIVLKHTEFRYNLLVSVEWEATGDYLANLEENIRHLSNFLYDVTDGQARLDTVYIFDHDDFAIEADLYVLANNMQWPRSEVYGIKHDQVGPTSNLSSSHIFMPRIWMGDTTRTRNYTDAIYPPDLVWPSKDYRTKTHELGHYAFGFYDEYLLWNPDSNDYVDDNALRCLPASYFNYGFMDTHYEGGGVMSSEMSNSFRYETAACRNTNQWRVYEKSCWDDWESGVETVRWGDDSLFVPILKPDVSDTMERVVSNPGVYFPGPNNDFSSLDYDVGNKVVFPNPPSAQAIGYSNKHVTVHHSTGGDNADVVLTNDVGLGNQTVEIVEGRTSDLAGIWVLGIKDANYTIRATKKGNLATVTPSKNGQEIATAWLYGMAVSGKNEAAGDSLTIELQAVQGDYPLISAVTLNADNVQYDITTIRPFPSIPTLDIWSSLNGLTSLSFTAAGDGYTATVSDSLSFSGSFTIWAVDDSSSTFFVPTEYMATGVDHTQSFIWLFGQDGQSEFKLDSGNVGLIEAMIVSSSYPVVRTGLDATAVPAGPAHCLAVYPHDALTGNNGVVLRYDDADLRLGDTYIGDEASLSVYHWINSASGWQIVGGTVDTVKNAIYAAITEPGVYAAFTNNIITDVDEDTHGDILPYRFELSQNYPNPFNPVTTIEYSLTERSRVLIEVYNVVGQRVRTLCDDEQPAGSYRIIWDGSDDAGRPVATGIYLYRFRAGEYTETRKMLLLK